MPNEPFSTLAFPPDATGGESAGQNPVDISLAWDNPAFTSEADLGYWGFGLSVETFWDSGLRYAPVAGEKREGTVIWRCHSEFCMKVVTCLAARLDDPPVMPQVHTGTDNDVLVRRVTSTPEPKDMPDGRKLVFAMIQYTYVLQQPVELNELILIPNSALGIPSIKQLSPSQFSASLYGSVAAPGGFSGGPISF